MRHAPVIGDEGRIYGQTDLAADVSELPIFKRLSEILPQNPVLLTSDLQRTTLTASAFGAPMVLTTTKRGPNLWMHASPVLAILLAMQPHCEKNANLALQRVLKPQLPMTVASPVARVHLQMRP